MQAKMFLKKTNDNGKFSKKVIVIPLRYFWKSTEYRYVTFSEKVTSYRYRYSKKVFVTVTVKLQVSLLKV